jgi:hypothetical protein
MDQLSLAALMEAVKESRVEMAVDTAVDTAVNMAVDTMHQQRIDAVRRDKKRTVGSG